jgi:hypothetical protein
MSPRTDSVASSMRSTCSFEQAGLLKHDRRARIIARGLGDAPDPGWVLGTRDQPALKSGTFDIPQHIGGLQHGCLSLRSN